MSATDGRRMAPHVTGAPDTVPIVNETSERVVRTLVIGLPPAALVFAGWLAWGGTLHWHDLVVLALTYTLSGLGVTVGYHRLFTHRSFKTTRALRGAAGRARLDGGRRAGDRMGGHPPQAPPVLRPPRVTRTARTSDQAAGWRGALRGLAHAHVGWMFRGKDMANPARYAKDLLADRDMRFISRTFPLWVVVGLAVPFGLGVALTGSIARRADRAAVGRCGAGAAAPPRDVQHQLAVSLLRPAAVRHRRRVAQPRLAGPDRASGRPGTTTTTPSRPPRATASDAASSIPAPG